MTDTWHTRTESKPVHITSQNRSSYPRIHPELHRKCRQHSGKQRADFVQGLFLLLAQGSTLEIKGPRLDIIHNFDKRIEYLYTLLQRNWEWNRPIDLYP